MGALSLDTQPGKQLDLIRVCAFDYGKTNEELGRLALLLSPAGLVADGLVRSGAFIIEDLSDFERHLTRKPSMPAGNSVKSLLKLLFGGIFVWMSVMTIRTSSAASLWEVWPSYSASPWAVATLWDVYFGFLTFYIWVIYKERKFGARTLWLLLIMGLENIAYVLIQLMRLRRNEPVETNLWSRAS